MQSWNFRNKFFSLIILSVLFYSPVFAQDEMPEESSTQIDENLANEISDDSDAPAPSENERIDDQAEESDAPAPSDEEQIDQAEKTEEIKIDEESAESKEEILESETATAEIEDKSSKPQSALSKSREVEVIGSSSNRLVEYYELPDPRKSFRERRPFRTWLLSLDYQPILPKAFRTGITINGAGGTYGNLYGTKSIQVGQLVVGPKFNFSLLSLGLEIFYGTGRVNKLDETSIDNTIEVAQTGVRAVVRFDNMFNEPYFVPYFAASMRRVDLKEKAFNQLTKSEEKASSTATGIIGTQAGVLFQLDWLDENAASKSFVDNGIENVFVDIYAQKLNTPSNSAFIFDTNIDVGGGIGFEF